MKTLTIKNNHGWFCEQTIVVDKPYQYYTADWKPAIMPAGTTVEPAVTLDLSIDQDGKVQGLKWSDGKYPVVVHDNTIQSDNLEELTNFISRLWHFYGTNYCLEVEGISRNDLRNTFHALKVQYLHLVEGVETKSPLHLKVIYHYDRKPEISLAETIGEMFKIFSWGGMDNSDWYDFPDSVGFGMHPDENAVVDKNVYVVWGYSR